MKHIAPKPTGLAGRRRWAAVALLASVGALGCRGSTPSTRHYTLVTPDEKPPLEESSAPAPGRMTGPVLVIEDFSADAAYVDLRMAYRTEPVRLDYYAYHQWAALPGVLVADQLRILLEQTGRFRSVTRNPTGQADAFLEGRVSRFEEVDVSADKWMGVIVLDLRLEDASTRETLASQTARAEVELTERSPAGLAWALSRGLTQIAARWGAEWAALADRGEASRSAQADQ